LPSEYDAAFADLLRAVADATADPNVPIAPFWPLEGLRYRSELLVIGRSVNGWVADWTVGHLRDASIRREAARWMRDDAEAGGADRMRWVEDLWGARDGYNTARSAFWRVLRRLIGTDGASGWASRLVWTNLYKASPAAGWNPGADLQRAQRNVAANLLRIEIEAFAPRRVLAMTGGWIDPFRAPLDLVLQPAPGLVEAVGSDGDRVWVVAKHPMAKPETQFVEEVRAAFTALGAALPGGR
jgi:hypothetical protein